MAIAEVEAYLHKARSMVNNVFGGGPGQELILAATHLASAMVQADAALRIAESNQRLAQALEDATKS